MSILLTVLSIIGIVIASVLGLVLLLLLILLPMRVRAVVRYDELEGFRLWAGLGPILLKLFPKIKKQKKKTEKKAKKSTEKTAEDFAEDPVKTVSEEIAGNSEEQKKTSKLKKKGFGDYIKALKFLDYIDILEKATKHFLSKIYFQKLHLNIYVASSDASKTAQMYGKLTVVIFPLLGLLDSKKKIKDGEVHIHPDFTAEKMKAVLDTEVCFRLFRALHAGIIILIYIYKTGRRKK